jgi:hypothetical protein
MCCCSKFYSAVFVAEHGDGGVLTYITVASVTQTGANGPDHILRLCESNGASQCLRLRVLRRHSNTTTAAAPQAARHSKQMAATGSAAYRAMRPLVPTASARRASCSNVARRTLLALQARSEPRHVI